MAISSAGLGSGLDISGIISKLMQVESQPLTALAKKEASFQSKLTAYGTIKGALTSFQGAARGLNDPSKFQSLKATSSDTAVATASAASSAVAGSYALDISKIAQSQKLVATGQASTTAAIGGGTSTTITFDFGTISGGSFTAYDPALGTGGTYSGSGFTSNGSGAKSITIDSSNNSLSGIRDAINNAKIGVTASIVNDGNATQPYRLVLSSDTAGKANSLKVSVSGDATLSTLLAHNPAGVQGMQETLTAQNTELTVNGVFVSKASTSLTDVIQGVTLTALKAGTSSVTVSKDSSAATTAVNGFVKAYNDLNKTLKDLTAYDAANKKASVLTGDSAVRTIQSQIRGLLTTPLGSSNAYTTLSQVGVSFQLDGTLAVDTAKLSSALSANPGAVAAVFAATGNATDSLVTYSGSTTKTSAGSYALNVTQMAGQAKLAGSAPAALTITGGANDALSVTLDGLTAAVTLGAGTYTAAQLAAEVQSKINGVAAFSAAGSAVSVSESGGVLTITSSRYGSASAVAVSGAGASDLLGGAPTPTAGLDVAATLGGTAGSGSGQYLTGATGSAAEGLKILISGGTTGSRGTVNFTRGYGYQLDKLMDSMLATGGVLSGRTEGINESIKDIGTRREAINRRLADVEARYRKQFTALDTLISNMNQTSNYLSQQLASLSSSN